MREPGVRKVEVDLPMASCLVEFDSGPASSLEMADLFAGCLLEAAAGYPDAVRPPSWLPEPRWLKLTGYPLSDDMLLESVQSDAVKPDRSPIEVATGAKRVGYLVLAGGAFAMTLVALVVPGIPTVPFLLATSYCLARSSRRLNTALRESKMFGPIVVEWEQNGGLSRYSKGKLIALTAAIAVVGIVVAVASPIAVLLVLMVSSLGIYGINQLPGLDDQQRAGVANGWLARLALPAP